jgi:cell division protein FtsI (penicillin-binding protein 3)
MVTWNGRTRDAREAGRVRHSLSEIKRARRVAKNERARGTKAVNGRIGGMLSKDDGAVERLGKKLKTGLRSGAQGGGALAKRLGNKLKTGSGAGARLGAKLVQVITDEPPTLNSRGRLKREASVPGPGRIRVLCFFLAASGFFVVGRAAQLQLIDGERYALVAQKQATLSASINAKRGVIKDRQGAELAITVDVDSIFAEPKKIDDPTRAASQLARVLDMPASKIAARLMKDRGFVYLKRRTNPQVAERVRALQIRGVSTGPEPKRFYANRDLAAHVLGFTSSEGEGVAGIERAFDGELRGKTYEVPGLRDALGKTVFSEGFVPHAILEGADVELTIDRQIQDAAEQALKDAVVSSRGRAGVAVVLQPRSGDVLALASYPTFNPNNLKSSTPDVELNRVVSAAYEPGSTMKMVTIAGALEDKVITPDDRIDCEGGRFRIGNKTINDSHHGYGELTIGEILKVSSNVCSAKIGFELGAKRLHHWLERFGFGDKTGIELPGELRGYVRPHEEWREIGLANVAFGQGLTVTPLQIVQAAATIANEGVRVRPRIVHSVTDKNGSRRVSERPAHEAVLSAKSAIEVRSMMMEVTKKGGTAESAAIPGFEVAGKTGTAQKIDPVTKGYSHELYVASFVGFVPAKKPQFVILVMVDEPRTSIFGGIVAAPAFRRIAVAALSAFEVFPEDEAARDAFLASYRQATPGRPALAGNGAIRVESRRGAGRDPENADLTPPRGGPRGGEMEGDMDADVPPKAPDLGDKTAETDLVALDSRLSSEAQALLGITARPPPKEVLHAKKEPLAAPGSAGVRQPGALPSGATEKGRMPNFRGLEVREVLNRSAEAHCDPVLVGTGRVIAQSPAPGDVLAPGARCELKLSPRG